GIAVDAGVMNQPTALHARTNSQCPPRGHRARYTYRDSDSLDGAQAGRMQERGRNAPVARMGTMGTYDRAIRDRILHLLTRGSSQVKGFPMLRGFETSRARRRLVVITSVALLMGLMGSLPASAASITRSSCDWNQWINNPAGGN